MPAKKTKKSVKKINKKAVNEQRVRAVKFIVVGLVLLNFAGLLWISQFAFDRQRVIDDSNTTSLLLFADIDKVKGYACGIFSKEDAENFMGVDASQQVINISNPARWNGDDEITVRHSDGCYYESNETSDIYAQVLFETFKDNIEAEKWFDRQLPPVSTPVEKNELKVDANRVVYDAGVHYILDGRQIIHVAASNGNPAESEEFSEELVNLLKPRLKSIVE